MYSLDHYHQMTTCFHHKQPQWHYFLTSIPDDNTCISWLHQVRYFLVVSCRFCWYYYWYSDSSYTDILHPCTVLTIIAIRCYHVLFCLNFVLIFNCLSRRYWWSSLFHVSIDMVSRWIWIPGISSVPGLMFLVFHLIAHNTVLSDSQFFHGMIDRILEEGNCWKGFLLIQ